MKRLLVSLALASCAHAQAPTPAPAAAPAKPFKMRTYMFVLLERGPAWTSEKTPESQKLFEGHMANIKAMGRAGKLLIAGPFDDDVNRADALAGIFIFDTTDEAEVKALLANDPAIAAGRLKASLHLWYGPTGLTFDGREEARSAP